MSTRIDVLQQISPEVGFDGTFFEPRPDVFPGHCAFRRLFHACLTSSTAGKTMLNILPNDSEDSGRDEIIALGRECVVR